MKMSTAITRLIPTMQSLALTADSYKFYKKKKKTAADFMGQGVKTIVGLELMKETSNVVESF